MSFKSNAVTLDWQNNNLVLRRGTSTLVVKPEHVMELRAQNSADEFFTFFRTTALQNREARRLFESWERKDSDLIKKIHTEMTN